MKSTENMREEKILVLGMTLAGEKNHQHDKAMIVVKFT